MKRRTGHAGRPASRQEFQENFISRNGFIELLGQFNRFASGPVLLPLLAGTGFFLTIGYRFMAQRRIPFAFRMMWRGRRKNDDASDISPFNALMTAMSAIVGTGNIASVATAICFDGSDALFRIWLIALAGMAIKFSEAALAVRYREKDLLGNYIGGPMYYTRDGLGSMCQHRAGSVRADHDHRLEFLQQKMHPVSVQRKCHQTVSLFLEAVDPPSARCRSSISVPSGWLPTRCMP